MSSLPPASFPNPAPPAAPLRAPKSLRVLGIIAIVLSCLSIPLILLPALATLASMRRLGVPENYITAIVCINAVGIVLALWELAAGIGMTCLKRWGRTLALIYAFACIPLTFLSIIGFKIVGALAQVALQEGSAGSSPRFESLYMGKDCVYSSPFSVVLIAMLLSGSIKAWAKSKRSGLQTKPAASITPPSFSNAATSAPAPSPAQHATPQPLQSAASRITIPADLSLSFPSQELRKSQPATFMTLPAEAPLGFAPAAPLASAPLPSPIAAPSPYPTTPSPAPSPKLSLAALFSLILAFIPFIGLTQIIALILGIIALRRISRSKGSLSGKGLAITGIIASSILLLLILTIVTIAVIFSMGSP